MSSPQGGHRPSAGQKNCVETSMVVTGPNQLELSVVAMGPRIGQNARGQWAILTRRGTWQNQSSRQRSWRSCSPEWVALWQKKAESTVETPPSKLPARPPYSGYAHRKFTGLTAYLT